MIATKLKKNDNVEVIAGKEKGKRGRIIAVLAKKDRVLVESLNIVKKHMRPSAQSKEGGILEKEGALHISNVMLVCPKCDKATRLGGSKLEDGRKVRVCRSCGESIDK
ncbi:MAG: 50S ribosomal protein L24 [Nitrospirota bacterium]|nr:50S ribosomal protein L24 [Nitrospirota bacterium]